MLRTSIAYHFAGTRYLFEYQNDFFRLVLRNYARNTRVWEQGVGGRAAVTTAQAKRRGAGNLTFTDCPLEFTCGRDATAPQIPA